MPAHERYQVALSFWSTALQYLALVKNAAQETVAHGNAWVVVSRSPITDEQLEASGRWSDYSILVALLFNLFHGIELLTKGFLIAAGEPIGNTHKISLLREKAIARFSREAALVEFLDKYASESGPPDAVRHFMTDNRLSVDDLYTALRYPSPDFAAVRRYASLRYHGEQGVAFFAGLAADIESVSRAAVSLGRRFDPGGVQPAD